MGCRSDSSVDDPSLTLDSVRPLAASTQNGHHLPVDDGRPQFCQRRGDDHVRDVFCGDTRPAVTSLRVLQDLLRLNPVAAADLTAHSPEEPVDLFDTEPVAVLLAHSTALSGHMVSPINPRAIVIGREVMLAFQRGIQRVELASRERGQDYFNFYLLTFGQACNARTEGCRPGDLYTPEIERNWTRVEMVDDIDLANTASDCRLCHQRGRERPILLMRELESPWTHFFEIDTLSGAPATPGMTLPDVRGRDLLRDYLRAKGDEPYAALSPKTIQNSIGLILQTLVPAEQPLLFDSPRIEDERWPPGPEGYPATPRLSETWARNYAAFKRGEQLPLPYFAPRPTDPEKQDRLTEAYRRYREGALPAAELPDLADIFPDAPQLRAEIGLQTEPNASPAEALVQACGACHNDVLDQTISRARFNIALSRMTPTQRQGAVARLELAPGAAGVMPPPEARQLDEASRARLVTYLQLSERSVEDDALLDRAAELGMTKHVQSDAGTRPGAYPIGSPLSPDRRHVPP